MTTTKETAAYVAASLTAQLKLDTMLEISKAWAQFYDTVLEKMGFEPGYDATPAHPHKPAGGRDIPIRKEMSQETIMTKIQTVSGRIIPVRSGELPKDAAEWAEKRGVLYVYDNRSAQAENSKRPAFKAVNEAGQDIKMEDGKTLSYWGERQ